MWSLRCISPDSTKALLPKDQALNSAQDDATVATASAHPASNGATHSDLGYVLVVKRWAGGL